MGTRVTTIVKNPNKDEIFFSNTTSFDTREVVEAIAKDCTNNEEVIEKLRNFQQFSGVRMENEGFSQDIYPFGDYEFILYVNEDRKVEEITIADYSAIRGKTEEELINLK